VNARPASCERTIQFVSLDLDGELSRFERAILERHLRRCPQCAADARTIVELTERLRAAPLEQIDISIPVVRRRHRVSGVLQSAVAVAVVAVVGVWLGVSASGPRHSDRPGEPVRRGPVGVALAGRGDWPAGLPRSPQVVQLVPGGLYTASVSYGSGVTS
jgi:anti-sigma factor RsiW